MADIELTAGIASGEAFGSAVLAGPIIASGIATAEAFGTLTLTLFLLPTGIATAEAFGTATMAIGIEPVAIDSEEAIGTATMLLAEGPGLPVPTYTIFINGVDRSGYIRVGQPSGPGINITENLNSRSTASLVWFDPTGTVRPAADDEIIVYEEVQRKFAGFIESTSEEFATGTSQMTIRLKCTDYGVLCDRRVIGKYYSTFAGGFLSITVYDIVTNYLTDTGITYGADWQPLTALKEQMFNHIPVTEAFNQIARKVNGDWRVDFWKRLYFFPKSTGWEAAPYTFTDDDGRWRNMRVQRTRKRYANRIYVKNSKSMRAIWTDTITLYAGQVMINSTYPINVKPVVTEDGAPQVVVELSQIGLLPYDYYYSTGGSGINRKWSNPASGGEVVVIKYPSPLPFVVIAEDTTEIDTYGLFEKIVEVRDVPTLEALEVIAAGELSRSKERPVEISVQTRLAGFEPGQLLSVNTTRPLVNNETLLIDSVRSHEVAKSYFWHTIKASDAQPQYTADALHFMSKLIEGDRIPEDRIVERINFELAGTIEGFANPGLTTGVKPPIRTATKDGFGKEVRLIFKSVEDGTPTVALIEIDLLKNGTTIFGSTKMEYPIGASGEEIQWVFVSEPYPVAKGDIFTINVLQADSVATDGMMEFVITG